MTKKAKPEEVDVEAEEHTPTPAEAKEMFAENPNLAAVLTTDGLKFRSDV